MKKNPFLSIVIANYNFGHLLPATLDSIIGQDCDDYEIIICDAGSKDNSVDVIKQYEQHIAWWVSEPDGGQSNAFNKGFSHSRGRFLTWLNSDDILLPDTIKTVKAALTSHPECQWATGNLVRFLHNDGTIIDAPWGPNYLPYWLQGPGRQTIFFGPTTFWSREVYDKIGPIDEALHLAMDVDYWYRIDMAGYKQVRVNHPCWGFRMHEDSKTAEFSGHEKSDKNKIAMQKEKDYIIKKNNYHPKTYWRYIGLAMRCLDGSMLKAMVNKRSIVGKKLQDVFKFDYNLLLDVHKNNHGTN